MLIEILDSDDGCTYTLDISIDDAYQIFNMRNLRKTTVDLPSIGGNAWITGNNVTILYSDGNGYKGHESIHVDFSIIQKIIDDALNEYWKSSKENESEF